MGRTRARREKLLYHNLIYVPTLIYVQELWVVTARIAMQIQAKMSFLHIVAGHNFRDRKSSLGHLKKACTSAS